MSRRRSPTRRPEGYGRYSWTVSSRPTFESVDYLDEMLMRLRLEAERRRRERIRPVNEVDRSAPQPIEVEAMECYSKENAKSHQTSVYDLVHGKESTPVLRRGLPFYLAVRFKRPYEPATDKIRLELLFGPKRQLGKGTLVVLPITGKTKFTHNSSQWDICITRHERSDVTLHVQIPPLAGVGLWKLQIACTMRGSTTVNVHECKENIYILFNPWCKDDPVYMDNGTWRQEYVLSDVGKIFVGSYKKPIGRPWVFGQFADACLPASILLLEKSGLDYVSRGNPVKVVRAISAMVFHYYTCSWGVFASTKNVSTQYYSRKSVNSADDNGVVVGNWSGNYDSGTAPWSWTGSTAILEEYLLSGGKPVKFGQCWVFSGVCTTVCRALGIPCRSVTNYVSAHDTDDSLTIDIYLDANGEKIEEFSSDSIWNFHVWNDCWMARPDLPSGYGGWQAVDATPQETSEGSYQAGPASIVAIRRGEISYLYDAPFVFSEVNADIVHWQKDEESDLGWKKMTTNTYHVGRLIVTKRAGFDDEFGDRDMEVISGDYKLKEGTLEERMSVLNAARKGGVTYIYDMPPPGKEDVRFHLRDIKNVMIGRPFEVIVEVENRSDEVRTVQSVLSCSTVHYTGIIARKVKRARGSFVLKSKQREELGIDVSVDDYLDKLVDYSMLKIYAIATVKETQQTWAEEDDFQVEKPTLTIQVQGALRVYRRFSVRISFANPLNKPLQDCEITVEGPGLTEPHKTKLEDVPAYGTMIHEEILAPRKSGPRKITAIFSSRQLIEIIGTKQVEIAD